MKNAIYFDMDGTIADLYGVENWLEMLNEYNPAPYKNARPLLRLCTLARMLNSLQKKGYVIGIISWLSKYSNNEYDEAVTAEKTNWLLKHMPSVHWDEIHIIPYNTPKYSVVKYKEGILFDDEEKNRNEWLGISFDVNNIIANLKSLRG